MLVSGYLLVRSASGVKIVKGFCADAPPSGKRLIIVDKALSPLDRGARDGLGYLLA